MRLLILGGTGQVGKELLKLASRKGIDVAAPDRGEFDLRSAPMIATMVAAEPRCAVINAAAYTEVDRAETDQSAAFALNAEAPARIATETARHGIPFIHISTDYIFDGQKGSPYVEEDAAAPLNTYGRSKLEGERSVRASNPRHVILRTSWVYSPHGKNFVKTILRLSGERERLSVVCDQHGCPTAASDIASACLDIATLCTMKPDEASYGTFHFAGAGDATWFEFASAIVQIAGDRLGRPPQVVPIPTAEYPTPASRPADARLDCSAIFRTMGLQPRPWRHALTETIDRLLTNEDRQ